MKRRFVLISLMAVAFLSVSGCALSSFADDRVTPPIGLLFTQYKAPLDINYRGAEMGTKKGTACASYIRLFDFPIEMAWGDASVRAAAKDGNIEQIHGADYEFLQVLGVFAQTTVIVYGE